MKIETLRLIIRPLKLADSDRVNSICSDERVSKYTANIPHPYSLDIAKSFIEYTLESAQNKQSYEYAICLKEDVDTVIGCIGIMHIDSKSKRAELGYWVDPTHWGKGIATEASKAMIRFAFDYLKLHSVYARHCTLNPASGKVMSKCGMIHVGKFRDYECKDGKYFDVEFYEILASDLKINHK